MTDEINYRNELFKYKNARVLLIDDFLKGKIKSYEWKASFDWIINPNNFVKIIEGRYDNKSASKETNIDEYKELINNFRKW